MIYQYKMKMSKKSFPVYAMGFGSLAVAISAFFWANTLTAVLFVGVALFIDYQILKTIRRIAGARVVTFTEGFVVHMTDGTKMEFDWEKVDYSGVITNGEHPGMIFAYNEGDDKIIQLPPVFSDFDQLVEELKENTPFKEYQLEEGETSIIDHLKNMLGLNSDEEEDDDDEAEDSEDSDASDETEETEENQENSCEAEKAEE